VASLSMTGCGGSGGEGEGGVEATAYAGRVDSVPDTDGRTPFDVLNTAVMTANTGDFAGAEQYILPKSMMGTDVFGNSVMDQKWPPFTHNGSIAKFEFVDEEYQGFKAYVGYRVHYRDGTTFEERASLTKENDRWKIAYMTQNAPF
jgi:hypothetical protein